MHQIHRILCLVIVVILGGCERDRLSPVDIKIDEDMGYTAVGDVALGASHKVSNGETLFDVANIYNIDPLNLAKINGIKYPYDVKDGQILRLPTENFPQQEDEDKEKILMDEKLKKKEIDDIKAEFDDMMKTGKPPADASSDEQVKRLSTPKITQTPKGTPKSAISRGMTRPVDGKVVSRFGDVKEGVPNDGINIKAPLGTPVKAAGDGEVIYAGNKLEEYGNTVIIKHDDGTITSYAHLNGMNVKNGTLVKSGDTLGSVGKTGDVMEPQLHFEVLKNKTPVDPSKYLK